MRDSARQIIHRFDKRRLFFRALPESARVLDIGCGSGGNGVELKIMLPRAEVHGIDIFDHADRPGFYKFDIVDLDKNILPFPDEFFDAVVFTHVIEHLRSPLELGKEIKRVMRDNASIYVETPNWTTAFAPSIGFHREQRGPFNFYDDPTHIKPWTRHGLFEFLFGSCELRVTKLGNTRNWVRIPLDIFLAAYGLMSRDRIRVKAAFWNLYGWCIYGVATKDCHNQRMSDAPAALSVNTIARPDASD